MGTFTIRNIEADLKGMLSLNAVNHGLAMEEEVQEILRQACRTSDLQGLWSRMTF